MPVNPALGRLEAGSWGHNEFKASLGFLARVCLKTVTKQPPKTLAPYPCNEQCVETDRSGELQQSVIVATTKKDVCDRAGSS